MNANDDFLFSMNELEKKLEKANQKYHTCLGNAVQHFLDKDPKYEDVTLHCKEQKKRVDHLFKELNREYH
jgi:hypothetical protein